MQQERLELQAQQFAQSGDFSPTLKECYMEGAKQAEKSVIDRAVEWLESEVCNYVSYDGEIDKELIEDFRKAMEE